MSVDTQPSTRPHVVRRKYLVDPGFQLRYMLRLAALGGGGVLLVGVLAYRALRAAVDSGASPLDLATTQETQAALSILGSIRARKRQATEGPTSGALKTVA